MNALPFKFNPQRHRRLLRLTKIRRIAMMIYIVCLSFFGTAAVFTLMAPKSWDWVLIGGALSILSGMFFYYISSELKREHEH